MFAPFAAAATAALLLPPADVAHRRGESVDARACMNRRGVAILASAALCSGIAPPMPALAYNPLGRLVEATKAKRLREDAAEALEEVDVDVDADVEPSAATPAAGLEESDLSTAAGLAKIDVELNAAYALAEDVDLAELRRLFHAPLFAKFLGLVPGSPPATERQLQLRPRAVVPCGGGVRWWRDVTCDGGVP